MTRWWALVAVAGAFKANVRNLPAGDTLGRAIGRPSYDDAQLSTAPKISGMCFEHGCTSHPCCCWSTFCASDSPDEDKRNRVCSSEGRPNAPPGYVLIKEPGYAYTNGAFNSVRAMQTSTFVNRDLCCTVSGGDRMAIASSQTVADAAGEQPETEIPPLPPIPKKKPTAAPIPEPVFDPTTTTTTVIPEDIEAEQLNALSKAHEKAAEQIILTTGKIDETAAAISNMADAIKQNTKEKKEKIKEKVYQAFKEADAHLEVLKNKVADQG